MGALKSLLEEALEAWSDVREGLIAEVENIPADHFDFRPSPHSRSVLELIQHILEVGLFMTGELTRPDTNFNRASWDQLIDMYAGHVKSAETKAQLLELLRSSMRSAEAEFSGVGELAMLQLIERFDAEQGTKLSWLHHGIAQEMYHRGQLVLYERLMGIEPALTRRIRESE